MNRFAIILCMFAVIGVSGCASQGAYDGTPVAQERTAGEVDEAAVKVRRSADRAFNRSLRK